MFRLVRAREISSSQGGMIALLAAWGVLPKCVLQVFMPLSRSPAMPGPAGSASVSRKPTLELPFINVWRLVRSPSRTHVDG
jgi:hypothetical protein